MRRTKILEPLIILILFIAAAFWVINTLNTGNPLWFLPFQPEYTPSRVIIHHYGESIELTEGMDGFLEIAAGLNDALSAFQNTSLVSIGLGDESLRDYYESEFAVEVFYPRNIEFNLPIRLRGVNVLLIPIDGRHSERNYVFIGNNREYQAGALQIRDRSGLEAALEELGYGIQMGP